ncbi:MAG: hypothetical protein OEV78_10890 [Spirochaetia bacterium]|nr:hypothetical protein [Spirochaetia bacterium]
MPSNQNKKISNRRKKSENEQLGIHSLPTELVEIERNLVENWLISLKHWLHINASSARKIIVGFISAVVLFFIFLFIHSFIIEKQNAKYYSILVTYEQLKDDNAVKIDEQKLTKLIKISDKLCNSIWSTRYSNNGCLLSAVLSDEAGNKKEAADYLAKFSSRVNSKAMAAYTAFLAGYFYETNHDLERSMTLYKKLDSYVDEKNGKDLALFHQGRILYYNDKLPEAEKSFKEIIEKYKTSAYFNNAKNYLMLIQMKKIQPVEQKK